MAGGVSGVWSTWTGLLYLIISFPYVIYEFWKFISPGLYENEKKNARGFIIIFASICNG